MIQAIEQRSIAVGDRFFRDLLGENYVLFNADGTVTATDGRTSISLLRSGVSAGAENAIARLVSGVAGTGVPRLARVSPECFAWAVPSPCKASKLVAVELVRSDSDALVDLVNRSSLCAWTREISSRQAKEQVLEQEEQLLAYAAQVTEDLEELTWLRSLATNLELSESGNSVERIAESVLPSLCRLIGAHCLVFIRDIPVTGMDSNLPLVWKTGQTEVSRQHALQIVAALLGQGGERTIVKNFSEKQFSDGRFDGVESCVLVPVATESGRLGWLLAMNKDIAAPECSRTYGDPTYNTYMREREFGTFEASLMSATALVLAAHGRNCGLFHEKELLLRGVIRSMINAIDAKDSYTCGHSDRVAEFSRLIAQQLSLDFNHCEQVYMTGLLHDVGKIGVPDHVLKKPSQLTDAEFESIKQHPGIGYEILKHLENLSYVLPGVLHHHEAMDGSGYPHGLKGDEIPLNARILAVADSYDAMTSNRPYRRGMPTEKAEAILLEGSGRQWDPVCVDAFFRTVNGVRTIARQRSSPYQPTTVGAGPVLNREHTVVR